ncbi:Tigger transposable element-derived protein 6, partial [Dictyocoela muelleri]
MKKKFYIWKKNDGTKNMKKNFSTQVFDEKLFEWFNNRRQRFCTVQDVNIQEMAMKLAKIYNVENFKASNGWLYKFKLRHNISSRFIKGESGLVDHENIESFKDIYSDKLKSYLPENIFNCDETGFYYKCTPSRTLCHKSEDKISGKPSKERVTLLFCVSMLGEKLDPLLFGKAKMPFGFKNLDFSKLKIDYSNNSKAWMNLNLFKSWLEKLNKKMKLENRKILLTLDNAPVHPIGLEFSNLEPFYFPPGLTSMIQPLDQGIINSFKSLYKKKLNLKLDLLMESNYSKTYYEFLKEFKLIDALRLILESWNDVSCETIIN